MATTSNIERTLSIIKPTPWQKTSSAKSMRALKAPV